MISELYKKVLTPLYIPTMARVAFRPQSPLSNRKATRPFLFLFLPSPTVLSNYFPFIGNGVT